MVIHVFPIKYRVPTGYEIPLCHVTYYFMKFHNISRLKNRVRHTARAIVSWPNPILWLMIHTSDLMMITRESTLSHNYYRRIGKAEDTQPHISTRRNWEVCLNFRHTRQHIPDSQFSRPMSVYCMILHDIILRKMDFIRRWNFVTY